MIRTRTSRRNGFTLIELLVSAALSVIIMAVMATAFQLGLDTMRQLRSAADMADQLRAAGEVLRRDLQGNIFSSEDGKPNNGLKLSNQRFDLNAPGALAFNAATPLPVGGFMFISSSAAVSEGTDADGLTSTFATGMPPPTVTTLFQGTPSQIQTTGHVLQFTSVQPNNSEQGVFSAVSPPVPGGQTFTSPIAEIAYFLSAPTPQPFTSGLGGGTPLPLFNLIRRQRLVGRSDDDAAALSAPNDPGVISMNPGGQVNTMQSLAASAANRLSPLTAFSSTSTRFGEDVLVSNVISFEVKVNWVPQVQTGPTSLAPRPFGGNVAPRGKVDSPAAFPNSTDFPFDTLDLVGGTFDSTNPSIRVLALQIRLRIFDPKMNNARQITIIQKM